MYGQYRDKQEVGRLLQSAVDPKTGSLDWNKAATTLAVSGRDPETYLRAATAQAGLREREAAQRALEQHYRATEEQARQGLDLRKQEIEQGKVLDFTVEDPLGLGPPKRFRRYPDGRQEQIYPPSTTAPPTTPAPAVTPAPQSALPGGPNVAQANPEEAPPYRVAGPPQPVPSSAPPSVAPQAAPVVPAATSTAARETALQQFGQQYGPDAVPIFRDILDYKRGLPAEDKLKQKWITAARQIDPSFDPSRFEQENKRPTKSSEMAARLGIGGKFQVDMEDQKDAQGNILPGIRSRIKAGELNKDWPTALAANYYKGGPGEVRQLIDDGAEALVRMLTGAGLNMEEARDYGNRFKFRLVDNQKESLTKANNLSNVLTAVEHAVDTGKSSPDEIRKVLGQRAPSEFAAPKVQNEAEANQYFGAAQSRLDRERQRGASREALAAKREELVNDLRQRQVPYADRLR
jgi:hypothetical protein